MRYTEARLSKISGELLKDALEAEIEKEALSLSADVCKIVPAELGEQIGDYGAIATALTAQKKEKDYAE